MIIDYIPKFLEDEKYTTYDEKYGIYLLTDEGRKNKEVLESYNEFYKELKNKNE